MHQAAASTLTKNFGLAVVCVCVVSVGRIEKRDEEMSFFKKIQVVCSVQFIGMLSESPSSVATSCVTSCESCGAGTFAVGPV